MEPLAATGERTAPGLPDEEYWFARHEAAYLWLRHRLQASLADRIVVDAGAGEGYGIRLLDDAGPRLSLALEYDAPTCRHAGARYPEISVVRANLDGLPLATGSVDVVVSSQVIEHLWSLGDFLRDCHRVLRPGGTLVLTTPNRPVFSPGLARGEKPLNPFHVEEFDADQVRQLMWESGFADITVLGLVHGARIVEWESRHGSIVEAQVDAVMRAEWAPGLKDMVHSVTAADFEVTDSGEAQDLICLGYRSAARD